MASHFHTLIPAAVNPGSRRSSAGGWVPFTAHRVQPPAPQGDVTQLRGAQVFEGPLHAPVKPAASGWQEQGEPSTRRADEPVAAPLRLGSGFPERPRAGRASCGPRELVRAAAWRASPCLERPLRWERNTTQCDQLATAGSCGSWPVVLETAPRRGLGSGLRPGAAALCPVAAGSALASGRPRR